MPYKWNQAKIIIPDYLTNHLYFTNKEAGSESPNIAPQVAQQIQSRAETRFHISLQTRF